MRKNLVDILFLLLILYVFKTWFLLNPLSSGDWSFNFPQTLKSFTIFPYIWSWTGFVTGLGGNIAFFLGLSTYFSSTANILSNFFNIPWVLIEKLVWFWPFLMISVFSSYCLFKKLFSGKFALLSSSIYLFNTYILMIVGGGQMGIAIAYSIVPLVLYSFIKLNENIKLKYSLLFGFLFGILVMFDLRIAYITLSALGIYFLFNIKQLIIGKDLKGIVINISYIFIIPFAVSGLLHAFWILPLLVFHQNPAQSFGAVYTSVDAVKFFSFAKFENAISLLHPNWPENIFGKVGFMKPEFLILPILAFSSLFFVSKTKDQRTKSYVLFFAILGLIGAFLAKGANEPFGGIYLWMFSHIPGFIMFRDPTKWYTLVAISYSILIPFSIWKIYGFLSSKFKIQNSKVQFKIQKFIPNIFLILVTLYLMFLIRPALLGQLTGTFKSKAIPKEYISLEKYISQDEFFYRTFWIPKTQRFGFYSSDHPVIPAQDFMKETNYSQIFKNLRMTEMEGILQESSVKYVIIPYDSEGEIFLEDRKYNNTLYERTVGDIRKIKWLKEIDGFGKIKVFEISNPKDHFWSTSNNIKINYRFINPTKHEVTVKNVKKGDILVFSESFDKYWIAFNSDFRIQSSEFNGRFNSFILPKNGDYLLTVYYTPQDWVNIGLVISGITLGTVLVVLIGFKLRKW